MEKKLECIDCSDGVCYWAWMEDGRGGVEGSEGEGWGGWGKGG